jgi:hypothetical protein
VEAWLTDVDEPKTDGKQWLEKACHFEDLWWVKDYFRWSQVSPERVLSLVNLVHLLRNPQDTLFCLFTVIIFNTNKNWNPQTIVNYLLVSRTYIMEASSDLMPFAGSPPRTMTLSFRAVMVCPALGVGAGPMF